MPRKYAPLKNYRRYSEEQIKAALNSIAQGLSLRAASKKHEIPVTVLHRRVKNGVRIKKHGGQTILSEEDERLFVSRLQICGDWGYPVGCLTLRHLVKDYLDRQGKTIPRWVNNLPGRDFVYSFLKRHRNQLSSRMCQNIKRSRAAVSPETINAYFDNLGQELKDIPPCNIVNYDETNLTDDPGKRLVITRRGCKYPERVMNSSKSSTSVMFAASGDGKILPPYVVYKAQHMYDSWSVGGPDNSRYNRTKSGWFDSFCFADWIDTIAIPYLKKLDGKKILIGDNLSSHLSMEVIKTCHDNNIHFVFLPSNSTHLTQPLDVAFFRPLKMAWRTILEDWKKGPGRNEAAIPKNRFPVLLRRLFDSLKPQNVLSGFKKCGIVPLNRESVLGMLPGSHRPEQDKSQELRVEAIDDSFKELLRALRHPESAKPKTKRVKVSVTPGKSVGVTDFQLTANQDEPQPSTSNADTGTSKKKHPRKQKKKKIARNSEDVFSSEVDSDINYSIQDSGDSDLVFSSASESEMEFNKRPSASTNISVNDYALIKVYNEKADSFRLYVVQVTEPDEDGWVGQFYKKMSQLSRFSETNESAFFSEEDIVIKLHKRQEQLIARYKDTISFHDDLKQYTIM